MAQSPGRDTAEQHCPVASAGRVEMLCTALTAHVAIHVQINKVKWPPGQLHCMRSLGPLRTMPLLSGMMPPWWDRGSLLFLFLPYVCLFISLFMMYKRLKPFFCSRGHVELLLSTSNLSLHVQPFLSSVRDPASTQLRRPSRVFQPSSCSKTHSGRPHLRKQLRSSFCCDAACNLGIR